MLVFNNALLIDGTGAAPLPNATVIIDGKFIKEVGQNLPVPENAQVIDLMGKPLLPGFSDAHTHYTGTSGLERLGADSRFVTYDYAEHRDMALRWGVTTLRSAGDYTPDIITYRNDVNAGLIRSPRLLACGRFFQARGGHPLSTVFSDNPVIADNACVLVDDDTDIEAEVAKLVDLGVDWIKAVISHINKMKYPVRVPCLTDSQLSRIIGAARYHGLPIMLHIEDIDDLVRAVHAGADTIEHTIGLATSRHDMTDEVLKLLVDSGVWVVPTLVSIKLHDGAMGDAPLVWPALQETAKRMVRAGVKLGVGCDSGIPFVHVGESVHTEIELLTEAGYTPLQAVTAATGDNARMLRMSHVFGTVAPGLAADLVVLGSDPLVDIRNTRDIKMVLREGAVVIDNMLSD